MQTDGYQDFTLQLGRQIQVARNARGLLQEDAAAMLGMTRVAVGYIEQGRRSPKLSTLYEMASLYDVDIRDFFAFLDKPAAGEAMAVSQPLQATKHSFRAPRQSKRAAR